MILPSPELYDFSSPDSARRFSEALVEALTRRPQFVSFPEPMISGSLKPPPGPGLMGLVRGLETFAVPVYSSEAGWRRFDTNEVVS